MESLITKLKATKRPEEQLTVEKGSLFYKISLRENEKDELKYFISEPPDGEIFLLLPSFLPLLSQGVEIKRTDEIAFGLIQEKREGKIKRIYCSPILFVLMVKIVKAFEKGENYLEEIVEYVES
jgi:hypothetical protein